MSGPIVRLLIILCFVRRSLEIDNSNAEGDRKSRISPLKQIHSHSSDLYKLQLLENRIDPPPFAEYESISKQEFESNDFQVKYRKYFIESNVVILTSISAITEALAVKMNKTSKAVLLIVNRFFKRIVQKIPANAKQPAEEANGANEPPNRSVTVSRENEQKNGSPEITSGEKVESISGTFDSKDSIIFEVGRKTMKHRNRFIEKEVVESGWSSKLAIFLYENTKVSCKFQFKNAWISKDGTIFTKGNCECHSFVEIKSKQNILDVQIRNIDRSFKHTSKYQVRGKFKEKLATKLKHQSALSVQTEIVNDAIPDN